MLVAMIPVVLPALATMPRKSSRNRQNMQGQPGGVKFLFRRREFFPLRGFSQSHAPIFLVIARDKTACDSHFGCIVACYVARTVLVRQEGTVEIFRSDTGGVAGDVRVVPERTPVTPALDPQNRGEGNRREPPRFHQKVRRAYGYLNCQSRSQIIECSLPSASS